MGSIIIFLLTSLVMSKGVFATVTPTPTPNISETEQQINSLKERIASRVAQLNLVDKKGIIGTVSDISQTAITIVDSSGNNRLIDVDELTKFSSPSAKASFGISDITKGTMVGIVGLYNKDSRRLLARWVDVMIEPQILSGGILSIDSTNYNFTIATVNSQSITISVEDITKSSSYTADGGTVRSGFSKLTTGERVMVVGFPDVNNKNTIIASRILVFPNLPPNPRIPLVKPEDIAPVSTGSGKKLTPITK